MKNKTVISFLLLIGLQQATIAQMPVVADTTTTLSELVVTAFEQNKTIAAGTIINVLSNAEADRYTKVSLVPALNTLPGIRMEERSPGSYRINIRGSSLRSPFGVRNVKVYWNNVPITDAGGNTYFNQFAFNNFASLQIIKGPAGSLYGAGTGGVILMQSLKNNWQPGFNLEHITGSFGLQNTLANASFGNSRNKVLVTYAHNQGDGYRNHSASKKDNVSGVWQHKIAERQQLTAMLLYSKLFYETPGGLNLAEYMANPKQSRPAAGAFASAQATQAAIYQQHVTVGVDHRYQFSRSLKNTTTLYGAFNQVKNPSIRNYERRREPGFGGRSSFVYDKKIKQSTLQVVAGGEWQFGYFNTRVFGNKNGQPDTLQTNDDVVYKNSSYFAQANVSIKDAWIITAGISLNKLNVAFTRLNQHPVLQQNRTYKNEFSPRFAVQKNMGKYATVFASAGRGFSPPTVAELLPSTGIISLHLEAESGNNYELGGRISLLNQKLKIEATGFYFKLKNALVVRRDSSNADFFVNAGSTRQQGIELSADYETSFERTCLASMKLQAAVTLFNFKYADFKKGSADFSGKKLPGVPGNSISILWDTDLKNHIFFNLGYLYTSTMFLNDANTASADAYQLVSCRAGWETAINKKLLLRIYLGVENLLNEKYSLGNDINAAAGRYYNAAPVRNGYAGISVGWAKKHV